MKYMSVCSGIEAATVAWHPLGWIPAGFSEFDPKNKFPALLLQHYYPDVENHGDMNGFRKWPETAFDVLVGGTPCQSFSVAGLRAGLADPSGNLALVYCAILARYCPRWFIWENVPGVLSSEGGRDFGAFLGAVAELGYGFAYRVLDAQYCGVPQRRRRVFVVGHFGDWRRAFQVLFEPTSLRRNPPPGREARQGTAAGVAKSTGASRGWIDQEGRHTLIPAVANPLTSRMYKGINTTLDEGQTPLVETGTPIVPVAYPLGGDGFDLHDDRTYIPGVAAPTADPLTRRAERTYTHKGSTFRTRNLQAFTANQRDEVREQDVAGALAGEPGMKQQTFIAFKPGQSADAGSLGEAEQLTPTLQGGGGGSDYPAVALTASDQSMAVRRLTPLECERLQGFEDGYTDIPVASDSARYKALGNSMAVPVMRWLAQRIDRYG